MRSTKAKNEILRRAYTRMLRDYYGSLVIQQNEGHPDGRLLLQAEDLVSKLRRSTDNLPSIRLAA